MLQSVLTDDTAGDGFKRARIGDPPEVILYVNGRTVFVEVAEELPRGRGIVHDVGLHESGGNQLALLPFAVSRLQSPTACEQAARNRKFCTTLEHLAVGALMAAEATNECPASGQHGRRGPTSLGLF